jgi:general secretion pathway protein L
MKCVGIDIGSFSIKIAEINAGSKSFDIARLQEFPLSPDPNRDHKIEILDLLRNLFNDYDLSNTRFILGLRQNFVSSRLRIFPFRERHKILKSLPFELEDDLPFSQEDAIFEAKITKFLGPQAEVFALASPKERIIEMLAMASDCGIDPDILSVEGLALSNLIEPFMLPPAEEPLQEAPLPELRPGIAILHMGHEHSVFVSMQNATVKLIRHIDWGGKQLAEAISKKYSMHYLEALKELQRKSFLLLTPEGATKDQILLSDTLKIALEPFVQDIRLSLIETRSDHHLEYKELLLTGGVGTLKGLSGYLTQQLEVATNRLSQVEAFPSLDFQANPFNEMSHVIAIGLAVEGLRRPKNPAVQFLRNEFVKQSQTLQQFVDKWTYTGQILLATFVFLLVYAYMRDDFAGSAADDAQALLKTQAAAVPELKAGKASTKAIKQFIQQKDQEAKTRALTEKIQDLISPLDILNRLSSTIPGRRNLALDVRHMKFEGEFIDFEGDVASKQEIDLLKNALTNFSMDNKVQTLPVKPVTGRVPFSYRVRVARTKGG